MLATLQRKRILSCESCCSSNYATAAGLLLPHRAAASSSGTLKQAKDPRFARLDHSDLTLIINAWSVRASPRPVLTPRPLCPASRIMRIPVGGLLAALIGASCVQRGELHLTARLYVAKTGFPVTAYLILRTLLTIRR